MVILDTSRRNHCVPRLAGWSLGRGIVATVGANLAHGLGHGPVGALVVSAWPALALVAAFELLMTLMRAERTDRCGTEPLSPGHGAPLPEQDAPAAFTTAPTQEQNAGTDGTCLVPRRSQPARHRPRTQHRPPQDQAHRASRMIAVCLDGNGCDGASRAPIHSGVGGASCSSARPLRWRAVAPRAVCQQRPAGMMPGLAAVAGRARDRA